MSQYYIARIRYQNPLPPPPFPPKLVDIPTPIEPYTTAEYTSTLAQHQPPNIDIDAEGGMPLDLAIIPGLFEGDESGLSFLVSSADSRPVYRSTERRFTSPRQGPSQNPRHSDHPLPIP
jgi:RNA polymerase II-associated factor 1